MRNFILATFISLLMISVSDAQINGGVRNDGTPRQEYREIKKWERQETNRVVQRGTEIRHKRKLDLIRARNSYRYVPYPVYRNFYGYNYRSSFYYPRRTFLIIGR